MKSAKVFTVINYVFSGILWLLGILALLFIILGLWVPWHLTGFGFIFYIPIPAFTLLLSLGFSCRLEHHKYLMLNLISLAISIGFVLLAVFVSAKW